MPPPSSVPPALPVELAAPPPEEPAVAPSTASTAAKPELAELCAKAKEIAASPPGNQRVLWRRAVIAIENPGIRKGFDAIGAAEPEPQCEMALQIAKEAGAPGWTCPDLQKLLLSMQ